MAIHEASVDRIDKTLREREGGGAGISFLCRGNLPSLVSIGRCALPWGYGSDLNTGKKNSHKRHKSHKTNYFCREFFLRAYAEKILRQRREENTLRIAAI